MGRGGITKQNIKKNLGQNTTFWEIYFSSPPFYFILGEGFLNPIKHPPKPVVVVHPHKKYSPRGGGMKWGLPPPNNLRGGGKIPPPKKKNPKKKIFFVLLLIF